MRIRQKSLLYGGHQFLLHPVGVILAWIRLYGWPTWQEIVCIIVHDWGYWFCADIDGPAGVTHPEFGAGLAGRWFGPEYRELCLCHSRTYAAKVGVKPSRLCWADKCGIFYMPAWLYLVSAWATGELKEYRREAAIAGVVPAEAGHFQWYRAIKDYLVKQAIWNTSGAGAGQG